MFRLCSKITITHDKTVYTLDSIKSVEATCSWDSLVDTAKVTLPKNIYVVKDNTKAIVSFAERAIVAKDTTGRAEKSSSPLFAVGDKIKIELGYDFNYNVVLDGVITGISATVPIVLDCADPMWLLNRITLTEELPSPESNPPTLSDLLTNLQGKFSSEKEASAFKDVKFVTYPDSFTDFTLNNYSIKNKTILTVLEEIKKSFCVYSYMGANEETGDQEIRCGEFYSDATPNPKKISKFNFQNNVISEELVDRKEGDVKVKIVATNIESNAPSSSNTTVEEGSSEADAKPIFMNFHKFKGEVKKQIESIAKRRIKTIRYDGYSGHFVTFGKPFVRQGDTIQLVDDYVTERNGYFKVKQVDYSFGDSGFRQKIYLHAKDKTVS